VIDKVKYRSSASEAERISDLMSLLPEGTKSALEIGARDGYISQFLAKRFPQLFVLDITPLEFDATGFLPVQASVTSLPFPDSIFDVVLCAQVLEHVPQLETACSELARVSKHVIVIGVPYRQDTRVGRATCRHCSKPNPAWGHVNEFEERKLNALFPTVRAAQTRYVGTAKECTNGLSRWLMDRAGNPWGTYDQDEPCIFCGHSLGEPRPRNFPQRICTKLATTLNQVQAVFRKSHANWIHVVFEKEPLAEPAPLVASGVAPHIT